MNGPNADSGSAPIEEQSSMLPGEVPSPVEEQAETGPRGNQSSKPTQLADPLVEAKGADADAVQPAAETPPTADLPDPVKLMEERMRRLEDALAALQDTKRLEEQIAERVASRIQTPNATRQTSAALLQTGKLLSSAAGLAGTTGEAQSSGRSAKTQKPRWLLFEGLAELRAFFLMYWDRDYRVRHLAWIVPGFALTVMVVSYFTIAYIPFVGAALDKLVDLFLAFFVIKVLQREADRYREHLAARKEQALL